ncbi:MAG: hypothetical protein IK077_07995 [Thermoguttaceae bacterium]|nr:hypothetical protein [Thermoguttaceae bacterium]
MSRRFIVVAIALIASFAVAASRGQEPAFDPGDPGVLSPETFKNPTDSVRPWVYYWQLKGNTSKELITRDLENMKEIGVGGLLVFDSRRYWDDYDSKTHVPVPLDIKYEFMSDEWVDMMSWLVSEAARLGLQVSFNISDSGGQLRGPWDMKELGPYELIWTEGNLNGPKNVSLDFGVPDDKPYYKDVAALAVRIATPVSEGREAVKLNDAWSPVVYPGEGAPRYDKIVDLTDRIKDDKLDWDVPEGAWKVLRFGAVRIGEPGCVDILNAKSVEDYFRKTPGALLDAVGENAGKTLSHFYNVSWEGVHPNWSDGFDRFFAEKRGYEIRDYLPILRGLAPEGDLDPSRFVVDYMKTISDSFRANCYETVGRLCHERGVRWHSEDGGPWNRNSPLFKEADMLTFWGQNDFPQGEFWIGDLARTNAPYAAMAAHIYGRRDVSLEAFTHMTKHWTSYPAMLKPYADTSFISGANFMIWHTYTASPEELGKPGFEYFAGSHVNSNVTWQPYVKPFMDYMARCQHLLRQGVPVADVCVYASDKNYETWGLAKTWNDKSTLALPNGYKYDLLDTKVLVERLTYEDGLFVLPGGAKYRVLVFDPADENIPEKAIQKIRDLAAQGAPIVLGAIEPKRSVGLENYPDCDKNVQTLADELWRSGDFANVFRDGDLASALKKLKIAPDFETDLDVDFIHRKIGDADIYFLAAPGKNARGGSGFFRVSGKKVSWWNPIDGAVESATSGPADDGRTDVLIPLRAGSIFVVFSDVDFLPSYLYLTEKETTVELEAPWNVRFDPKYGGPEQTTFDQLTYWNENDDPGIRYYSGTATYSTEFELTEEQASKRLELSLGTVRDIARVRLNGKDLGVVWTDPWTVELQDAPKAGKNLLEIDVCNCWRNRLIGDAALEPEQRFTKTNVVLLKEDDPEHKTPAYRGYLSTDPLEPSGLIGPVVVKIRDVIDFEKIAKRRAVDNGVVPVAD